MIPTQTSIRNLKILLMGKNIHSTAWYSFRVINLSIEITMF